MRIDSVLPEIVKRQSDITLKIPYWLLTCGWLILLSVIVGATFFKFRTGDTATIAHDGKSA